MFAKNRLKLLILFSPICLLVQPDRAAQSQTNNQEARKFDEFGDILYSDLIARLDNFAIQLQQEPGTRGFIFVYRTRRDLPGLSNRYALRMKNYLMVRGIAATRVVTVDGGIASCLMQELWIVPVGATPKPRSDAYDNSFADPDTPHKFDEHFFPLPQDVAEDGGYTNLENLNVKLDGYGAALRRESTSQAYIIAYAQNYLERGFTSAAQERQIPYRRVRLDPPGTARKMLATVKSYLVKTYSIAPSRIKVIDGGYRTSRLVELWIVPPGANAPIPTPNQFPGRKKGRSQ